MKRPTALDEYVARAVVALLLAAVVVVDVARAAVRVVKGDPT